MPRNLTRILAVCMQLCGDGSGGARFLLPQVREHVGCIRQGHPADVCKGAALQGPALPHFGDHALQR